MLAEIGEHAPWVTVRGEVVARASAIGFQWEDGKDLGQLVTDNLGTSRSSVRP